MTESNESHALAAVTAFFVNPSMLESIQRKAVLAVNAKCPSVIINKQQDRLVQARAPEAD